MPAQVIVSKRLLCHYVTWKIAAPFNQRPWNPGYWWPCRLSWHGDVPLL